MSGGERAVTWALQEGLENACRVGGSASFTTMLDCYAMLYYAIYYRCIVLLAIPATGLYP
jgi:hypothetical protein